MAVTSPTNFASQRVLQKSGLVYERDIDHEGALAALFRVTVVIVMAASKAASKSVHMKR